MSLFKICRLLQLNTVCHKTMLRCSSQYRKPFKKSTKTDQFTEIKQNYFQNRTELTAMEWQELTKVLVEKFKHINSNNIDSVIVGVCSESQQLEMAKSFINYLKTNGKGPNDATLGKMLRIYNSIYHARGGGEDALSTQEQNEVLTIFKHIREKHDILDYLSCENLIYGIVCTKEWKEGLKLLDMIRMTASPSIPALTELTIKAFRMEELTLGWRLFHTMLEQNKQPKCEVFIECLKALELLEPPKMIKEMENLLSSLGTYDAVITEKVAKALSEISKRNPLHLELSFTKLKRFGLCISCNQHLKNVSLSDEEFENLRSSFLDKVLIRNDVFQRSTPEEVESFRNYVKKTGPYDCVIDGLNVAYSRGAKKPKSALANLLADVVRHFRSKNKNILVLGRKHMNNWPQKTMRYIKENAALFLANDISQDDPFLLYATLHSGPSTDFFSRDFMRQHAHLLGPELKPIFRRWQQEHQYSLVTQMESGKLVIKEPIRYLICAHKVACNWHIPYKMEYTLHKSDLFEIPEHWLCIKIKKN